MTTAQAIASLPDDTPVSVTIGGSGTTVGELRLALSDSGPVLLTTQQASERYGWSPGYWASVAPDMPGAFRDRMWHLPREGCEAHVARKRRRRAPATPSTGNSRPSGLQER